MTAWVGDRAVAANEQTVARLEGIVGERIAGGRWDSAAAWAGAAASYAVCNPTGWLRHCGIEGHLAHLASRVTDRPPARAGGVLHVASEVHRIGGHRAMLQRWLVADRALGVRADLALTRPFPVHAAVADAVRDASGTVHHLGRLRPMDRAARLRALATGRDAVVCHVHSDDPVPVLALAEDWSVRAGVPVVVVDHADHLAWLVPAALSSLVSLRAPGADAAVAARGIASCAVVPMPIPVDDQPLARHRPHRRPLVLLTLARDVKYRSQGTAPGFPDVVAPVVAGLDDVVLVAVGPAPDDPGWQGARRLLGDRLLLPGPTDDPGRWLDRADIHLDSFPFGSTTSLLEAAARGTPVLAGGSPPGRAALLSSDGAIEAGVVRAESSQEYAEALRCLASDAAHRDRVGRQGLEAIQSAHAPLPWRARLSAVYSAVSSRPVLRGSAGGAPAYEPDYAAALRTIESAAPLQWILATACRDLDARDRAAVTSRISRLRIRRRLAGRPVPAGGDDADSLLPDA